MCGKNGKRELDGGWGWWVGADGGAGIEQWASYTTRLTMPDYGTFCDRIFESELIIDDANLSRANQREKKCVLSVVRLLCVCARIFSSFFISVSAQYYLMF